MAALSQALDFIDKFRKNQESKEDQSGGPDPAEIENLASNLQEASQGVNQQASKVSEHLNLNLFRLNHLADF